MEIQPLAVSGAWECRPDVFPDHRGRFCPTLVPADLATHIGHTLTVAQLNTSVSRAGVIRGVHFADVPPGQAKYVSCISGAVIDVVVDLRADSQEFGRWDARRLDGQQHHALYIAEGLGHAFLALDEDTVVSYACSTRYAPAAEHTVNPWDAALGIPWQQWLGKLAPVLSERDSAAPEVAQARAAGMLPTMSACRRRYAELAAAG